MSRSALLLGVPAGLAGTPSATTPATAGGYSAGPVIGALPTVSSNVVPFPAGAAVGDTVLVVATWNKAATTVSGVTTGVTGAVWAKPNADSTAASNHAGALLYRKLTSADVTAGSVTLTFSTAVDRVVTSAIRVVGGAAPVALTPTVTTSSTPALAVPAHTPTATGSLLLAFAAIRNSTTTQPIAVAPPAGWTEAGESSTASTTANTWTTWVGHRSDTAAGVEVPGSSGSTTVNSVEAVWLVEVPPGAGAAGPGDGVTLPLVPAQMADPVADFMGVSIKDSVVINATTAVRVITYLGFRHARLGKVDIGGPQREIARALAALGNVDVIGNVDDTGARSIMDRITEVFTQWGGAVVRCLGGANEPQKDYTPSTWPMRITGEPDPFDYDINNQRTSNDLSVGETQRVARGTRIKHLAFIAANPGNAVAAAAKRSSPSFSMRSHKGWFAKLASDARGKLHGVAGQPDIVDYGELHNYTPADDLSKSARPAVSQATYIAESRDLVNNAPVLITETGWHGDPTPNISHQHTPPDIAGLLAARSVIKLMDIPRCLGAYVYEAADNPAPEIQGVSYEKHFGLFYSITETSATGAKTHRLGAPKPQAVSFHSLTGLFADPGPAFTPAPLGLQLENTVPDLVMRVHQKRDGTHLVSLYRDVLPGEGGTNNSNTYTRDIPPDQDVILSLEPARTLHKVRHVQDTRVPVSRAADGTVRIGVGCDLITLEVAP